MTGLQGGEHKLLFCWDFLYCIVEGVHDLVVLLAENLLIDLIEVYTSISHFQILFELFVATEDDFWLQQLIRHIKLFSPVLNEV